MQEQQVTDKQPQQGMAAREQHNAHTTTSSRPRDYAYYKAIFANHPMPFAYLDLDLLNDNIQQVIARAAGKRVRLASKSLRSVAMLRYILDADPCFQGIMCYSPQEAVYLAGQGFSDLLIGYPIWNKEDIVAIARATIDGAAITLMVDSVEHVEQIENIAQQQGARLPLCLEIDLAMSLPGLHFGVWRSPLRTPRQARPIIRRIMTSKHLSLDGIMGYEAQIAGVGDNFPAQKAKNALVYRLKQRSIHDVATRRAAFLKLLASYGLSPRVVNGGGTGSITSTRAESGVTEITVGSAFYAPTLFDNYRDFRYQPAAGFAIEIVRHPTSSIYTCLGGGYIASGAVGTEKQPQPYLPVGAKLDSLEGAGEVQTPIRYKGSVPLRLGDPIFMRHSKAGELCERFTHLLRVSNGTIQDEVTTYRGDGQCFI